MKSSLRKIVVSILYWDYFLLFFIFFLVFIIPIFPAAHHSRLYNVFFTLIYVFAAMAIGRNKKFILWFAGALIVLEWLSSELDMFYINDLSRSLSMLFFFLLVILFIIRIAKSKEVDAKTILDAINGYLLLSIVFSILIGLIMRIDPRAFNFPERDLAESGITTEFMNYMYYSIVSITTLGYGDIVPKAPYAKSLATFISICGQFYIAILLALLVGKYAAGKNK
jgi:hypothetical protein